MPNAQEVSPLLEPGGTDWWRKHLHGNRCSSFTVLFPVAPKLVFLQYFPESSTIVGFDCEIKKEVGSGCKSEPDSTPRNSLDLLGSPNLYSTDTTASVSAPSFKSFACLLMMHCDMQCLVCKLLSRNYTFFIPGVFNQAEKKVPRTVGHIVALHSFAVCNNTEPCIPYQTEKTHTKLLTKPREASRQSRC